MKRCPAVKLDDLMPSISTFTVSTPSSAERMHRIECRGLTHFNDLEPQRIDLGQGKLFTASLITSDTISEANRPSFSIIAKYVLPFLSSLTSS